MPLSPGARLGREVVYAVVKQDLPVIIGGTIVASALVVAANLVVQLHELLFQVPGPLGVHVVEQSGKRRLGGQALDLRHQRREFLFACLDEIPFLGRIPQSLGF